LRSLVIQASKLILDSADEPARSATQGLAEEDSKQAVQRLVYYVIRLMTSVEEEANADRISRRLHLGGLYATDAVGVCVLLGKERREVK